VKKHVSDAAEFIISQGVKALVVACNTATSVAIQDLRLKYDVPIIGMEPAVKPAVEKNGNSKRVLVTATPLTLKEEKLKNLIAKVDCDHMVDLLPLPGLVEFAERLEFIDSVVIPYLKKELSPFDISQYGTIVLGCTHFPLFRDKFRRLLPQNIDILDGNIGTVKNLKHILENSGAINEGKGNIQFYNSGHKVEGTAELCRYDELFKRMDSINKKEQY
jgi:glutamate racemase